MLGNIFNLLCSLDISNVIKSVLDGILGVVILITFIDRWLIGTFLGVLFTFKMHAVFSFGLNIKRIHKNS